MKRNPTAFNYYLDDRCGRPCCNMCNIPTRCELLIWVSSQFAPVKVKLAVVWTQSGVSAASLRTHRLVVVRTPFRVIWKLLGVYFDELFVVSRPWLMGWFKERCNAAESPNAPPHSAGQVRRCVVAGSGYRACSIWHCSHRRGISDRCQLSDWQTGWVKELSVYFPPGAWVGEG